jgi:hypothetical protein
MMRRRPPDGNRNLARAAASGTNATDDSYLSFSSPRESGVQGGRQGIGGWVPAFASLSRA